GTSGGSGRARSPLLRLHRATSGRSRPNRCLPLPFTTLRPMTDEEAIRTLVARHAQLTDDGAVSERVKLYVEDGVFDMAGQRVVGREAMAEAWGKTAETARQRKHITSNTVIEIEGDSAKVQTAFAFFRVAG